MALPGKADMDKLNHARVGFKHKGNIPAEQTIERCGNGTLKFLTAATPAVVGVEFDTIDMADLVTQPEVARLLREAQTYADIGDYVHAMAGLSLAFDALMDHYAEGGRRYRRVPSPFAFGPRLSRFDWPQRPKNDTEKALAKVMDVADKTQAALRAISLGIDFPRYMRFAALTPKVHGYFGGRLSYSAAKSESMTAEDYDWSRHFVIESALHATRADGVHELLEAKAEINLKASLSKDEVVTRDWTGPAVLSAEGTESDVT